MEEYWEGLCFGKGGLEKLERAKKSPLGFNFKKCTFLASKIHALKIAFSIQLHQPPCFDRSLSALPLVTHQTEMGLE